MVIVDHRYELVNREVRTLVLVKSRPSVLQVQRCWVHTFQLAVCRSNSNVHPVTASDAMLLWFSIVLDVVALPEPNFTGISCMGSRNEGFMVGQFFKCVVKCAPGWHMAYT